MKLDDVYPSNFLKPSDCGLNGIILTIANVAIETVGTDTKPVCTFQNTEKKLTLNKTNFIKLQQLTGSEDSDSWGGHQVVAFEDTTQFNGRTVPCIRLRAASQPAAAAPQPAPHQPAAAPPPPPQPPA